MQLLPLRRRRCFRCGRAKLLALFSVDKSRKYGRTYDCKQCRRGLGSRPQTARVKQNSNLRLLYGITVEQYDELFEAQGGCCAICGGECKTRRKLAVDHNHNTGDVRGLLCV